MIELQQLHFLRPWWLLAFLPGMVLCFLMYKKKLGSRSWEAVCDDALLPYILTRKQSAARRIHPKRWWAFDRESARSWMLRVGRVEAADPTNLIIDAAVRRCSAGRWFFV